MELAERIDRWMDDHRDQLLTDVAELVAVKSVKGPAEEGKPFGEGPAKALDTALSLCRRYGLETRGYSGAIGVARLGDEPCLLDMLAHLDVVGEGDGWDTDPYTAVEKDGCLYGRGTDDDKGPLVQALYAMRCVKELGLDMKGSVRLIMGTDEESGSEDLPYFYSVEKAAPATFSPDASFPVYNTEKGHCRMTFFRKWEKASVTPRVTKLSGGYRINVLPADAWAEIRGLELSEVERICARFAPELGVSFKAEETDEGVRLSVTGRACHASTPDEGINGITALLTLLDAMQLEECASTMAVRALVKLFPHGDGAGKALGIAMSDELSGALTLAFSLLDMDENGIEGSFDARVPVCATKENCGDKAQAALKAMRFETKTEMTPPHHTPADSAFIKTLLSCYEDVTGERGQCLSMGGGTYVHDIEGGVAFGSTFPGFDSNLHAANERMSIEAALKAAKIYARVIAGMCC